MFAARPIGLSTKQHAPQADRNKGAIIEILQRVLPDQGMALEIGSGTGQHVMHFARAFPSLVWQPSDYDQVSIASIESYRREAQLHNVREPLLLEARKRSWGNGVLDAVLAINLIHVTNWSVCEGLFDGRVGTCGPTVCCSSTDRSSRTVASIARATRGSTPSFARRTLTGACATWKPSRPWARLGD